jgi:hypothetical protein
MSVIDPCFDSYQDLKFNKIPILEIFVDLLKDVTLVLKEFMHTLHLQANIDVTN